MLDLVGNPEDRFSRVAALIIISNDGHVAQLAIVLLAVLH